MINKDWVIKYIKTYLDSLIEDNDDYIDYNIHYDEPNCLMMVLLYRVSLEDYCKSFYISLKDKEIDNCLYNLSKEINVNLNYNDLLKQYSDKEKKELKKVVDAHKIDDVTITKKRL